MVKRDLPGGVVHALPADLKKALISNPEPLITWEEITPLARNEWICWIESAKKAETEPTGLSGDVQAFKRANAAPVVGRDASTDNRHSNDIQTSLHPTHS